MNNKYIWIGAAVLVVVSFLAWLFWASSKPLPGVKIADLGREHVAVGTKVEYNSNPPTSGKHYGEWVRAGVYETERDDRNLVHSLEHGYVVMSYKCVIASEAKQSSSENEEIATPASGEARNDECEVMKNQLAQIYNKKGKRKLIVVPRENLDTNFALTAWTYLDKFDDFDAARIEKFIDTHRDQGPERTME